MIPDSPRNELIELDRVARSTLGFLRLVAQLEEQGASIQVLSPALDLSGPVGRVIATVLAAFAELEFHTNKERQREGIERARAAGRPLGRRRTLSDEQRKAIRAIRAECEIVGVDLLDPDNHN